MALGGRHCHRCGPCSTFDIGDVVGRCLASGNACIVGSMDSDVILHDLDSNILSS